MTATVKVAVVGLGKIGLPLAVQFAGRGHHVIGADVDDAVVRAVRRAVPPFPGERELAERLAEVVGSGALEATTDTASAVSASDVVVVVVPLYADADGNPEFSALDAATADVAAGLRPGTLVSYETTLPVGTTRNRLAAALEAGSGLRVGRRPVRRVQPGAGLVRPGLRRPRALPQAGRRRGSGERAPGRRLLRRRACGSTSARTWPGPTACGTWARRRPRSWRSWPRRPTATSTSVWPTSSRCTPTASASTSTGSPRPATPSPSATCTRPGSRWAATASRSTRGSTWPGDPDATIVRAARAANSAMPERAVQRLADVYGDLRRRHGRRARGLLPGRGQGDRVLRRVRRPSTRCGRAERRRSCTTRCSRAAELAALGLEPYRDGGGSTPRCCRPTTQEYRGFSPADLPGVTRAPRRARRARPRAVARRHGDRPGAVDGRLTGLTAGRSRCPRHLPAGAACRRCRWKAPRAPRPRPTPGCRDGGGSRRIRRS